MQAFLFPGQGAQKTGMGRQFFDSITEFRKLESYIDGVLGYSIRELCIENPENKLIKTQYTQPCLYVVNFLYYRNCVDQANPAQYLAGHSLGELNALLAAGAFDFLTGLRIVKQRGELMAQAKNGAMAAVIGPSASYVEKILEVNDLSGLDIANYNSPNQTVISGPIHDIRRARQVFQPPHADMYIELPVTAAFHSRYMKECAESFGMFLEQFTFSDLSTDVISNATAKPYPRSNVSSVIKASLVQQIVSPVRWEASIRYLIGEGVTQFLELGPGDVLSKLTRKILSSGT